MSFSTDDEGHRSELRSLVNFGHFFFCVSVNEVIFSPRWDGEKQKHIRSALYGPHRIADPTEFFFFVCFLR